LIESSALVRSGLAGILETIHRPHVDVVELPDAAMLRHTLQCEHADILIVNPTMLGQVPLPQIKKEIDNPHLKCIALQTALADDTVLKYYDEVVSIYDSPEQIQKKLMRIIGNPKPQQHAEPLSTREKDIVVCIVKGMSNKQIAEHLNISTHTVISHRRNISAKLQIHSAAGLTIYAIVNKLVKLNEIESSE
jgi:DNA-binding NarL/FixJ family response regulator